MPFLNDLDITFDQPTGRFILEADFTYQAKDGAIIVAPKGFSTDFASIPKMIPRWVIDVMDHDFIRPPVIHDFLYSTVAYGYTRAQADKILFDAALEEGMPYWKAAMAYAGVRAGGNSHWREP